MGVPLPIIFVIIIIMSIFTIAAFILFKKRNQLFASQHTIDKMPSHVTEQEEFK